MRIDFTPRLQMIPVGAILGGAQAIGGLIGGLIGSGKARRAQRELENLQTPTTESNSAVADYYNQARNPYSSLEYQLAQKNANAGVATGLTAFQDRRSGLAGIGGLVRQRNNALLQAGASAASKLGAATQMKASDDERVFNINKMLPYQKKFSILAQKASGANQVANAGWSNLMGGLQTAAFAGGFGGNKGTSTGLFGADGSGGALYTPLGAAKKLAGGYSGFEQPSIY